MARLGMLTPSSNTVLEPVTGAMLRDAPDVTAHFSRFPVTHIALSSTALGQFTDTKIVDAARLLADAKVDVIAWNGTSAGWLGFETDEHLCRQITSTTGVPACTSVLAYREVFRRTGARRIGLVTPYRDDVQAAIVENLGRDGFSCTAERHLGLEDNFAFSEVDENQLAEMTQAVVRDGVDAVAILCTNLRGAGIAARMEEQLGVPVYDSVAITVWKSLLVAGAPFAGLSGWGSLFTNPALATHAEAQTGIQS